ncbi:MAG: hypothetical protein KME60_16865 [Cyanomargarita calcarea GSE-NOS-MK-12-04C]|uniref:Uncharacterized protein n=1 Tax=Cyanomargarita calcarea GSE-NOS-MK-12-04C TaxID=2839659 RepID=A0A951UTH2_9CYAN|nr:hypothetical protein [Cyanomargarita calcarea GSE-NOS-MK-12-04C]
MSYLTGQARIDYESIINIRPSKNNRSMIIQDPGIQEPVRQITTQLIGGYEIDLSEEQVYFQRDNIPTRYSFTVVCDRSLIIAVLPFLNNLSQH